MPRPVNKPKAKDVVTQEWLDLGARLMGNSSRMVELLDERISLLEQDLSRGQGNDLDKGEALQELGRAYIERYWYKKRAGKGGG